MRKTNEEFRETLNKPKLLGSFFLIVTTALSGATDHKKDTNSSRTTNSSYVARSIHQNQSATIKSTSTKKSFWGSMFSSSSNNGSSRSRG